MSFGPNLPAAYCQIRDCGAEELFSALLGVGVTGAGTAGAETGGNTIAVTTQAVDAQGNTIASQRSFFMWLSDTAGGTVTADPPSGGTSATTGVIITEHVADVALEVITDVNGVFVLSIVEAGADSWYVNVRNPDGTVTSTLVTFA